MSGIALLVLAARPAGGSLAVSSSPPFSYAGATAGTAPFYTPNVTAITAGGSGTYTYSWSIIETSHDAEIVAPTSATTALRITSLSYGNTATATMRCTVTDSLTGATGSVDVPALFFFISLPALPF